MFAQHHQWSVKASGHAELQGLGSFLTLEELTEKDVVLEKQVKSCPK